MTVNFLENAPITVGATLSHGGEVLEGNPNVQIAGHEVSTKGCRCECDLHGATSIKTASGKAKVAGQAIAVTGDVTQCGAVLTALLEVGQENQKEEESNRTKEQYEQARKAYDAMSDGDRAKLNGLVVSADDQNLYSFFAHTRTIHQPVFVTSITHSEHVTIQSNPLLFMRLFILLPIG